MKKTILIIAAIAVIVTTSILLFSRFSQNEVNIYTHRHYDVDQQIFDKFTEKTAIKVNVVSASADELIQKLALEGENSLADILITVDAGRLQRAKEQGLLQPIDSKKLRNNIPLNLRDPESYWFGLTYRGRIIVYAKDRVNPEKLSTYEELIAPKWKGKILTRSSENVYNQSLLASIIIAEGAEKAKKWAAGIVQNMARPPKGSDCDQIKAVAGGRGDLAIVNTYYVGKLLNSNLAAERKAAESVGVFFPNQGRQDRGAHVNVSGGGVTAHAPNKKNAIKLLEFLSDNEAQEVFAQANFEYPVKRDVKWAPLLESWGTFKAEKANLSEIGKYNKKAVEIFDEVGWK